MQRGKKPHLGGLPPRYQFMLNPYPEHRVSRCPLCEHQTGQRKVPLLIHVHPHHLLVLGYTCRFCPQCDLLIGHKHEIEHLLTELFRQYDPCVIGNEYLIVGTVEKRAWRESMAQPKTMDEMLPHASDFAMYYEELRMTQAGWFPRGMEPPLAVPSPSKEWVKAKAGSSRLGSVVR